MVSAISTAASGLGKKHVDPAPEPPTPTIDTGSAPSVDTPKIEPTSGVVMIDESQVIPEAPSVYRGRYSPNAMQEVTVYAQRAVFDPTAGVNTGLAMVASIGESMAFRNRQNTRRNLKVATAAAVVTGASLACGPACGTGAAIGIVGDYTIKSYQGVPVTNQSILFNGTLGAGLGVGSSALSAASGGGIAAGLAWEWRLQSAGQAISNTVGP